MISNIKKKIVIGATLGALVFGGAALSTGIASAQTNSTGGQTAEELAEAAREQQLMQNTAAARALRERREREIAALERALEEAFRALQPDPNCLNNC